MAKRLEQNENSSEYIKGRSWKDCHQEWKESHGDDMKRFQGKKRHRISKFDPYIEEIGKYVVHGCSVREIAELIEYHFDDVVSPDALYVFMRSRGLQSRVTSGGTNLGYKAPNCVGCTECIEITNTTKGKSLLCLKSKTMIPKSCTTSPMFCHKREQEGSKRHITHGM